MTAPRLDIRLDRIQHNARVLVERLARRGISVTGVTKATLGNPEIAQVMLDAGVANLGDARIENIETLKRAGLACEIGLIRSPMLSQADRVVASADFSYNTEFAVLERLSHCAKRQDRVHGVMLMVELGDLREGVLPRQVPSLVAKMLRLPNLALLGIGTNLACQSGVTPDRQNMEVLSALATSLEVRFALTLSSVSGGNSASLGWALNADDTGNINGLRLGEAILLGRDPLDRSVIAGLRTDAFTLVAEVIECSRKPTRPWGVIGQTAFGPARARVDRGVTSQAIVALGRQDTDPDGLRGDPGQTILGASSDHLVLDAGDRRLVVGTEVAFQLDYGALLRAMTSPFVARSISANDEDGTVRRGVPGSSLETMRRVGVREQTSHRDR